MCFPHLVSLEAAGSFSAFSLAGAVSFLLLLVDFLFLDERLSSVNSFPFSSEGLGGTSSDESLMTSFLSLDSWMVVSVFSFPFDVLDLFVLEGDMVMERGMSSLLSLHKVWTLI